MEKMPITLAGYGQLEEELKRLKHVERPAVIEAIAEARGHGDLKENAEYHAAREKQGFIEGRIAELEGRVARAEVIDVKELKGKKVLFGATVELVDCDTEEEITYQIVSDYESNLEKGKISYVSPLARGLIGKSEGDEVSIQMPKGKKNFEITKVSFAG